MDNINQSHEIKSILRTLLKRCYFKEGIVLFLCLQSSSLNPHIPTLEKLSALIVATLEIATEQIPRTHTKPAVVD
jgi:hypothetical protein